MTDAELATYVDAACAVAGLVLTPDERGRVIEHFARAAALAQPLLELALPADVEIAAVFHP